MDTTFISVGVALLIYVIIGGELKISDIAIPPLKNVYYRIILGFVGISSLLLGHNEFAKEFLNTTVECKEQESCVGVPIACLTSNENPKETLGKENVWLYHIGQPESQYKRMTTGMIAYGEWNNPECKIHGVQFGWSANIGSCGIGKGDGIQRCIMVRVRQTMFEHWFKHKM